MPIYKEKLLEGKVALITGGGSGIGFAIAKAFSECGAKCILVGRNEEKLQSAIQKLPTKCKILCFDVCDTENIPRVIDSTINLFESKRIDILVNCAGILKNRSF